MERPETRYVEVGGVEVAYQVVGKGPPDVVYVPGFSRIDLRWEHPVMASLSPQIRRANLGLLRAPGIEEVRPVPNGDSGRVTPIGSASTRGSVRRSVRTRRAPTLGPI
jgi:hypothetical protein